MDTEKLAQLIAQKRQVLELLARLGQAQATLIDGGDMSRLLPVLAAKQKLINQLQQTERAIDPFRNEDPESRQWRSVAERETCRQDAEQCERLLAEVMQLERAGEAQMIRRRDAVAEQLQGVHHAFEVHNAYADSPAVSNSYLDLSSGQ